MKQKIPNSPFATNLSGSAKEVELRLHNIFQWKKKRPPVFLLLAALLMAAGCGSVVEFNTPAPEDEDTVQPQISMDVQDYDASGYLIDILEIPTLVMPDGAEPNDGVNAINRTLADFKEQFLSSDFTQCILYPTETGRYINLLFFQTRLYTDLNTGHIFSLVYDKEEGRQVALEDALTLAGVTEQELYGALSAQYDPQLAQQIPDAHIIIQNQALEGFRMGADGQPIFYLTARSDDADDTVQDYISGGENLYIWSDGQFTIYEQYEIVANDPYGLPGQPLVPTEETVKLNPPLWCQWYFESGEPEGGFPAPENTPAGEPTGNQADAAAPSVTPDQAGVSPSPNQENEEQKPAQPLENLTPMEAYKAVLQGEMEFRNIPHYDNFDISRLREAVTPDTSITLEPQYFSAVDLDADGASEVIVSLAISGVGTSDYLVLRWQDGVVYGYTFAEREFSDVRTDGTFWNTGGASDVGICKVTFDKDTYSVDRFTYSLYSPSESGDGMSYFVDHQEVTEEEWNLALSRWKEIPYVNWHKFTDENIELLQ